MKYLAVALFAVFAAFALTALADTTPAPASASQPTKLEPIAPAPSVVAKRLEAEPTELDLIKTAYESFKGHKYREGAATVILLLVFFLRRFSTWFQAKVPSKWLPLFVAGLAFVGSVPIALASEGFSWASFVWNGLICSAEATFFYSLLGKFILPKVFGEVPKG